MTTNVRSSLRHWSCSGSCSHDMSKATLPACVLLPLTGTILLKNEDSTRGSLERCYALSRYHSEKRCSQDHSSSDNKTVQHGTASLGLCSTRPCSYQAESSRLCCSAPANPRLLHLYINNLKSCRMHVLGPYHPGLELARLMKTLHGLPTTRWQDPLQDRTCGRTLCKMSFPEPTRHHPFSKAHR